MAAIRTQVPDSKPARTARPAPAAREQARHAANSELAAQTAAGPTSNPAALRAAAGAGNQALQRLAYGPSPSRPAAAGTQPRYAAMQRQMPEEKMTAEELAQKKAAEQKLAQAQAKEEKEEKVAPRIRDSQVMKGDPNDAAATAHTVSWELANT
ncbi:MAG TPA: hypothetical protein VMW62_11105 [Chloroflexota bacterium]|nr:hypothetical protein [Chloroflexota bacterium]